MTNPLRICYYTKSVREEDNLPLWRDVRVVEGTGLENRRRASVRGFESHSLRHIFLISYDLQKYPRGRRGSPAKGVGCLKNAARVQIPPSAPARRKRHIACAELFHFIAKLIARSFCCSSLPNRTRCRWAPVWGLRCAALLSAPEKYQF